MNLMTDVLVSFVWVCQHEYNHYISSYLIKPSFVAVWITERNIELVPPLLS